MCAWELFEQSKPLSVCFFLLRDSKSKCGRRTTSGQYSATSFPCFLCFPCGRIFHYMGSEKIKNVAQTQTPRTEKSIPFTAPRTPIENCQDKNRKKKMINATTTDILLGFQVQADYWLYVFFTGFAFVLFWRLFASQIKSILYPRV